MPYSEYNDYTETCKEDRSAMARILGEKASEVGAKVIITEEEPRLIRLDLALAGYQATIEFNGKSVRPNIYVIPWHTRSDNRLSDAFGVVAGGTVNQYHRHKCTAVAHGFDNLITKVTAALTKLADGSAFIGN